MSGKDMQMIADRWMMESRRLVNWGSYEGYHEFRPSTDSQLPVTLLAGASESGKSTLVDAQISLLYPTGTPFNKASNSGRSERSDYTYLRGMIGVGGSDGVDEPDVPARPGRVRRAPVHMGRDRRHLPQLHHRSDTVLRQVPLSDARRRARRRPTAVPGMGQADRPAPHGRVPRVVVHAHAAEIHVSGVRHLPERRGVPHPYLGCHGPERGGMPSAGPHPVGRRPLPP